MSQRISTTTVLRLGKLDAPVALFRATGPPVDLPAWAVEDLPDAERTPAQVDPLNPGPQSGSSLSGAGVTTSTLTSAPPRRARGVRREDGSFIDLTEQIARIETATQLNEMRVTAFIRREQVPREWIQGSYWVGPNAPGMAPRTLQLLHASMKQAGRYAVVKWVKRSRQAYGVMVPHRSGALLILELAWADCIRTPDERILGTPTELTEEEIETAAKLIKAMSDSAVVLEEMEDDAVVLRRELMEGALAGKDMSGFLAEVPDAAPEDLMHSLEETLTRAVG